MNDLVVHIKLQDYEIDIIGNFAELSDKKLRGNYVEDILQIVIEEFETRIDEARATMLLKQQELVEA